MTPATDEKHLQQNAIGLLTRMGYTYISPEEMARHRDSNIQVVLRDVLRERLAALNSYEYRGEMHSFDEKTIERAIDDLDVSLGEGLMAANQKITDQLVLGNAYAQELPGGERKSFSLHYIDFEYPENNVFHVTEEFEVARRATGEGVKTRRPDLVLFVNGIPFGVVELKSATRETEEGISQMIRNQGEREIPQLFKYAQITLAGNNHTPKYGTVGTPARFYAEWKERLEGERKARFEGMFDRGVSALSHLEQKGAGVLTPSNLDAGNGTEVPAPNKEANETEGKVKGAGVSTPSKGDIENGTEVPAPSYDSNETKFPTPGDRFDAMHRTPSPLDETLFALFDPERALELMARFILFDNKTKKIARYQQYFAVKRILARVREYDESGRRKGGLVWHTQGSGKSLTMVMLANALKRDIPGSKLVVVTDRRELDRQIHRTFNHSEVKAERARSGRHLVELLRSGASVVTTLIHKFEKVAQEKAVFDDAETFILVDESHRTQGGDLHKAMRKVFPKACYIGFTGTPLMRREKNSFAKFGGEIHRYTIDQAVRDKAVLPLLYEGRLVDQWINDEKGLDRRFERIARDLSDEQKLDLKRKWAKFQKVASSERRLEAIMLDINEDYKKRFQGTGFKAMLATASKYEAIKYHKLFEELGDIRTAFVISPPDSREGHSEVDEENKAFILQEWQRVIRDYGDAERYEESVKDAFVNGDEIELLIVVDKLLTGFDAPRAAVLYIDKLLKEHNLLQAIARVNRLFDGKDFGFIVDYRGLLGDLDKALTDYSGLAEFDEEDLTGAVFDVKEEIARLKTYYTRLEELFAPIGAGVSTPSENGTEVPAPGFDLDGFRNKTDGAGVSTPLEQQKDGDGTEVPTPSLLTDMESYEVFLADEEKRKRFYDDLSPYARALQLALSSDKIDAVFNEKEIAEYKAKMKFYAKLRQAVRIRYHERVDFGKYEKQMQKLLDTFISAEEVDRLTKPVNIFEAEFDDEVARVEGSSAKADAILHAVAATISEKRESNPAYYDRFSKRIKEIIEAYKAKRLSEEEKLKQAREVQEEFLRGETETESDHYPEALRGKSRARAFYDNLETPLTQAAEGQGGIAVQDLPLAYGEKKENDLLTQTALRIDEVFREASKKPDWQTNRDVRNRIEERIDDILWELEQNYGMKFDDIETLLKELVQIGVRHDG